MKNQCKKSITSEVRSSPFFRLLSNAILILGGWVGKEKKNKNIIGKGVWSLDANIRGAWKQQGVVAKSTWRQLTKIDVVVKIKREQRKLHCIELTIVDN